MKKIAVLISGSGSNLEAIAEACRANRINGKIVCVISNNPDAYGIKRAQKFNLQSVVIDHNSFASRTEFENKIENYLDNYDVDLIVLAGFMRILGENITKKYFGKMINLHPSLLPKYPGLDTHKKVIQNGDAIHGISIHYVTPELDAGPIIAQGAINITHDDNIESIEKRIHMIEHQLLPEIINEICLENIYLDVNTVMYNDEMDVTDHILINYDE